MRREVERFTCVDKNGAREIVIEYRKVIRLPTIDLPGVAEGLGAREWETIGGTSVDPDDAIKVFTVLGTNRKLTRI